MSLNRVIDAINRSDEPEPRVLVRVTAGGRPVPGVVLRIAQLSPLAADAPVDLIDGATDGEGEVVFSDLTEGTYSFQLLKVPPDFAIVNYPDFDLDDDVTLEIDLHPGGTLSGTVSMSDGGPLTTPVFVRVIQGPGVNDVELFADVAADGTFSLDQLSARMPAIVSASTVQTHLRTVTVAPAAAAVQDIVLDRIDATVIAIRGRATTNGRPRDNLPISAETVDSLSAPGLLAGARTDADGRYAIASLPPGDYRITAWFDRAQGDLGGPQTQRVTVVAGAPLTLDFVDEALPG